MHIDSESVEIGIGSSTGNRPARSNPMNMPSHTTTGTSSGRPAAVPVLIESGSCSKKLMFFFLQYFRYEIEMFCILNEWIR